jgi:hypothetical protein
MNTQFTTMIRRIGGRLHVLCLLCALAMGPLEADADGGPGSATAVSVNGPAVDGNIRTDIEKDWFAFSAVPYAAYTLSVTTGSVWDCEVELRTPDGVVELSESSTVYGTSGGMLHWTNRVAGGKFYIRVGGFAEFTTGSYQVAVSGGTFTDANANGLPDIWELQEFGNLTNTADNDNDGDGLSNKDEYWAGTHPTNSASGFFAQSLKPQPDRFGLTWQAIHYGAYRVLRTTNLLNGSGWWVLGTNLNTDGSGLESYSDTDSTLSRAFYRIEYLY